MPTVLPAAVVNDFLDLVQCRLGQKIDIQSIREKQKKKNSIRQ